MAIARALLTEPRVLLAGDIPTPAAPPRGCNFCTRCHRKHEVRSRLGIDCDTVDSGVDPRDGRWYWIEARVENHPGSTWMFAKVWADGDPYPTDWSWRAMSASRPSTARNSCGRLRRSRATQPLASSRSHSFCTVARDMYVIPFKGPLELLLNTRIVFDNQ